MSPTAAGVRSPPPPIPGPPPHPSPYSHPPPSNVAPFPYPRAPLPPTVNPLSPGISHPASPTPGQQLHPYTFPLPSPSHSTPLPPPSSVNPALTPATSFNAPLRPPPLSIPQAPSPAPAGSSPRSYFVTDEGTFAAPPSVGSSPSGQHRQHFYPSHPSVPPAAFTPPEAAMASGGGYKYPQPKPQQPSMNGVSGLPPRPPSALAQNQFPQPQPTYGAAMQPPSHMNTPQYAQPAPSYSQQLPQQPPQQQSYGAPPQSYPQQSYPQQSFSQQPAYTGGTPPSPTTPQTTSSLPVRFSWVTPAHPAHFQMSSAYFPDTPATAETCHLPLGVLLRPLGPGLSLPPSEDSNVQSTMASPMGSSMASPSQVHASSPGHVRAFSFSGNSVSSADLPLPSASPDPTRLSSAASVDGGEQPRWERFYRSSVSDMGPQLPLIRPGAAGVIRCKDCKAYISGYSAFIDQGRLWKCIICGVDNPTPSSWFSPLDAQGRRTDWAERPELYSASYELLAPKDYSVRPPVPPLVCACIDVSRQGGGEVLSDVCAALIEVVELMSRHPKALMSIVTYGEQVHYYTISTRGKGPQMHVLTTLDDLFLPSPVGMLIRVSECRHQLLSLFNSLPRMHAPLPTTTPQSAVTSSCMASALECCMMIMGRYGGRLMAFVQSLCTIGRGSMVDREREMIEKKQPENKDGMGVESALLKPATTTGDYYKKLSEQLQKHQITVDLHFFPPSYSPTSAPGYLDVATYSELSRYTGGQLYYWPRYTSAEAREALQSTILGVMSRPQCFESVFRVRVSRGVVISDFHGHFSIRGNDLLAIPCVDVEKGISFELKIDDKDKDYVVSNKDRAAVIQCGLLFTSFIGERRIVVHTVAVPIAREVRRLLETMNVSVAVGLMAKRAVWLAYSHSLQQAREYVRQRSAAVIRAFQKQSLPVDPMWPALSLGLLKGSGLVEQGAQFITPDVRSYHLSTLYVLALEDMLRVLRPRMWRVWDMQGWQVRPVQLTRAELAPDAIHVLHNGVVTLLRVGHAVDGRLMQSLFDQQTGGATGLRLKNRDEMAGLQASGLDASALQQMWTVLDDVRLGCGLVSPISVVREGDAREQQVAALLLDDQRGPQEWYS